MQCNDSIQLKSGQKHDPPRSNTPHHVSVSTPENSNPNETIIPDDYNQSHWINSNYPPPQHHHNRNNQSRNSSNTNKQSNDDNRFKKPHKNDIECHLCGGNHPCEHFRF